MIKRKYVPEIRFEGFIDEWEEILLGNESYIVSGGTPSTTIKNYWEPKEIPWLSSGEVNKKRIYKTNDYISKEGFVNSSACLIQEYSVLIALAGQGKTRGTVAINYIPLTTNQSIAAITPTINLDHEFLFQNLGKRYNELRTKSSGDGSRGGLNKHIISEITICCPNPKEQSLIGSYFRHLDKLINLKQNNLDKLVTLKKSMLEKMFPKDGEDVPVLRFMGFTEKWREKKLGEIGCTYTGLSGKTKEDFGHGEGRYVTYLNVFSNPVSNSEMTESVEIDKFQNEVQFGDVFFTTSSETPNEVGMSSVWLEYKENVYLNSFCFGYRPKIALDNNFLAYSLRSSVFRKKIAFLAQGISRYNISKNRVMEIFLTIPNIAEQNRIGNLFRNLDKLISLHQKELDKLKNIKKACLEKMFV